MGDATLADFGSLAGKVAAQEFPIMPQPTWGQDAAYVGFVIDRLLAENDRLRAAHTAAVANSTILTVRFGGYARRDRFVGWLANQVLRLASRRYRAMIDGAIRYGLRAAASDAAPTPTEVDNGSDTATGAYRA